MEDVRDTKPAQERPRIERRVSAGGVVYRRSKDGRTEVLLCGRRDPRQWRLPKGTPALGENREETALREVREETGFDVRIVAPLGKIEYWFSTGGTRCHKTVYHYLMEPVSGSTDQHDPEFDIVKWFGAEEAGRLMTFENEAAIVRRALEAVEERHGAAR